MGRAIGVLVALPLCACGGISYVEAPVAPAPTTTSSASVEPAPEVEDAGPPATNPAPTPLSATATSAAVARTTSFYASAAPFECDLDSSTTTQPKLQTTKTRLHLTFERPGRLRVVFAGGAVLVVNAGVLWLTDPQTSQVMQASVPADYTPLALAYAGTSFASRATFIGYPGAVMNAPGLDVLVAIPTTQIPGVTKALYYDAASGQVTRTLLVAPGGTRQRLDVVQCTMHTKPPAASLFVPPSGQVTAARPTLPPLLGIP